MLLDEVAVATVDHLLGTPSADTAVPQGIAWGVVIPSTSNVKTPWISFLSQSLFQTGDISILCFLMYLCFPFRAR